METISEYTDYYIYSKLDKARLTLLVMNTILLIIIIINLMYIINMFVNI